MSRDGARQVSTASQVPDVIWAVAVNDIISILALRRRALKISEDEVRSYGMTPMVYGSGPPKTGVTRLLGILSWTK